MVPKDVERIMKTPVEGLSTKELLIRVDAKVDTLDLKLDQYVVTCEVHEREIKNIKTLGGIALTGALGIIAIVIGVVYG